MIENLTICHVKKGSGEKASTLSPDAWSLFETCQRKIYISMIPDIDLSETKAEYIEQGEFAYLTLLNVLCGMESRIVGETEVFGQFKLFVNNEEFAVHRWFKQFQRIAQDLIADVKDVRHHCMQGTGHRSYGSIIQTYVKDYHSLAIIGGGHLVQKTLPYLNNSSHQISIFLRSPIKAKALPERLMKNVTVFALAGQTVQHDFQGLIIAAPIKSEQIETWLKPINAKPSTIVDLRDKNGDRKIDVDSHIVTLEDIFTNLKTTSKIFANRVAKAKVRIQVIVKERSSTRYFRPFGWEDICA